MRDARALVAAAIGIVSLLQYLLLEGVEHECPTHNLRSFEISINSLDL